MKNPLIRLRAKVVTSFMIAALGLVTFVRLLGVAPMQWHTLMPFVVTAVLVIAGVWRGLIYWQASAELAKADD